MPYLESLISADKELHRTTRRLFLAGARAGVARNRYLVNSMLKGKKYEQLWE